MNNSNKIMYFLGIGGIGMSALARWYKQQGAIIFGYDIQRSQLTEELINEGMTIHFESDINQIPENISIAIYTPAIPSQNIELIYLKNLGVPILKRAEIIGRLTSDFFTIAIAGTHGKTSISALTAHLLKNSGIYVTAFVRKKRKNYNSNLILSKSTEYMVVEADEYDRSLLQIKPNIAVISSIDEDHLDIYKDYEDLKSTFEQFVKKLPPEGVLIHNSKLGSFDSIDAKNVTYGIKNDASLFASNIHIADGKFIIDIDTEIGKMENVEVQIPGFHNIENTLAATAIAIEIGLSLKNIRTGIITFKGVERRMDFRIDNGKTIFIDDYAHHPEEIKATISAVKKLYPNKKLTGIFQPHLFSRTRDFAIEFAAELSQLDELILMDIYPAREEPIEDITSHTILNQTTNKKGQIMSKEEILEYLFKNQPEVLVTMGAGDIGLLANEIETQLLMN
jgi:UDP-N-acetylmuramate--alanine ligase